MLRDNLAGLIEPMVDRAGAHPLGGHQAGSNGGCSRSTELASVALKRSWRQLVRWKTGRPAEKAKWPGFEVTTAAHDSRAVSTAWHQSHRTIDPQCLKKSPPRRGGIYALTENVALHFTLNQDTTTTALWELPPELTWYWIRVGEKPCGSPRRMLASKACPPVTPT